MNKTFAKLAITISISSLFVGLYSCSPKKEDATPTPIYSNGVFIVNEGPYGSGTGTISFIKKSDSTVIGDIFGKENNQIPP